jgi:putative colanic acid biosynthesis acetyltransferase WcaF
MKDNKVVTKLAKDFDTGTFQTGATHFKIACWYVVDLIFFRSGIMPFSVILVGLLRLFGSDIGKDVRIKPYIKIKYPWKLKVGDHSWLGNCTIENLDKVAIGKHVCISQGAVILTGNHNHKLKSFNLFTQEVILEDGVWICAHSIICPGVTARSHSILNAGSIATKTLEAYSIYQGNPAQLVSIREISLQLR